jgi:prepilin-type N-terminal cleavage/methylation domain-containing protein
MRLKIWRGSPAECPRACGFTLVEVMMAIVIVATVLGGMTVAYTQATRRAQWTGYALAAQALSVQTLEQARSAVWDQSTTNNEITKLNLSGISNPSSTVMKGYSWANLDLPISGTNAVRVTNYVTVTMYNLTGLTNVQVQMVRVDTVWPFRWGNINRLYTNSVATYCAPDNRNPTSL